MILTHGANSLDRAKPELLYLTYLNNFDLTTKKDTPIIGTEIQFSNSFIYTLTSMSCMGVTIPALELYQNGGSSTIDYNDGISIPASNDVVSLEAFFYGSYRSGNYGVSIKIGESVIGCDPNGWGFGFIVLPVNASNIQVFNGQFEWPLPGYYLITAKMGYYDPWNTGSAVRHTGTDIAGSGVKKF